MAYTALIVEFSPSTDPLATPVWVDISSSVNGPVSIRRGRGSEFDSFSAGTCSLRLDNTSRNFDPLYASGSYYGNLRAKKRLRIRTATSTLFTGWIAGWPQSIDWKAERAWVELSAQDALGLLAGITLDTYPYVHEVLADSPKSYFKLSTLDIYDVQGAVTANLTGSTEWKESESDSEQYVGLESGSLTFPPNTSVSGSTLDAKAGLNISAPFVNTPGTNQSVEFWIRCGTQSYERRLLNGYNSSTTNGAEIITVTAGGALAHKTTAGATTVTSAFIADGLWHHIVFTSNNSTVSVYVDGSLYSSASSTAEVIDAGFTSVQFRDSVGMLITPFQQFDGSIRSVAFYDTVLSAARVSAHFLAAEGWPDDLTGARIGRYLDMAGWPTADRSLDTGTAIVPPQGAATGSALDLIQTVAFAEGGAFFGTTTGTVQFRQRTATNEVTAYNTTQATFGNSGSDIRYEGAQPALDDAYIRNVVNASRTGGKVYTFTNSTSISRYFRISDDTVSNMYLRNDADVVARGLWIISNYADPTARLEYVLMNARHSAAALSAAQTLDILHRIVVKVPHPSVGSATTYTVQIDSVEHSIDVTEGTWRVTYNGMPADTTSYFILGTSALGGASVLAP